MWSTVPPKHSMSPKIRRNQAFFYACLVDGICLFPGFLELASGNVRSERHRLAACCQHYFRRNDILTNVDRNNDNNTELFFLNFVTRVFSRTKSHPDEFDGKKFDPSKQRADAQVFSDAVEQGGQHSTLF